MAKMSVRNEMENKSTKNNSLALIVEQMLQAVCCNINFISIILLIFIFYFFLFFSYLIIHMLDAALRSVHETLVFVCTAVNRKRISIAEGIKKALPIKKIKIKL